MIKNYFSVFNNKTENFVFYSGNNIKNAIVISKKCEKYSNKRNKVRRRIKEIVRNELGIKKENYVIIVRKSIIRKKYIDIKNEIKILTRIEKRDKSE